MKKGIVGACLLGFAAAFAGGGAMAASVCQAGHAVCATTMPVGGYCECVSRGHVDEGTVVDRAAKGKQTNATAGGCGEHPTAPGCR